MEKVGKGIAIGSGIVAMGLAAAGIARYAAVDQLARVAFDRDCPVKSTPRQRRQLKGSYDDPIFSAKLYQCAKKLRQQNLQTVTILASDGKRLVGHWSKVENAKRVIIAMHGWRSSWDHDFGMAAEFFRENGCSVLYAEQRGQNSSEGEYIGFGVLERHDCLDWINWVVKETKGELPVYLAGISMGATTVMLAAGLTLPEQVKGILADCGFTSIHDISHHVLRNNLHLHYGVGRRTVDGLVRKRLQVGAKDHSTVDVLKNVTVPLLLVHGAADSFVPVSMAYENFRACKGPKELLVVPGADHGMSYYLDKQSYEAAVRRLWQNED